MLDVCVDYVGRDGTVDMDEVGSAASPPRSRCPSCSTRPSPRSWRRACSGSAAGPSSTRPTSRTARRPAAASTGCARSPASTAPRSSACSSTRRARPATSSGRCGSPTASTTWPPSATASRPSDLIFDALTFPLSTGDDDLRRDAMATIEAIRRIKAELPGVYTTLGLSNVSFGLKPAARHVLNSVFLHECVRGRARLGHRARGPDHAAQQDPRGAGQGLPRPDLRPPRRRPPGYDPLAELLDVFADVTVAKAGEGGPQRLAGRRAAQGPHHRRRPRRPHRRPRRGHGRGHRPARASSTTSCSPA